MCLTLVQCSLLLCLSWTILSTKMHLHMFPLLKMLCKTIKFFHLLKMRKNVLSLLQPNDRRLAVLGSPPPFFLQSPCVFVEMHPA